MKSLSRLAITTLTALSVIALGCTSDDTNATGSTGDTTDSASNSNTNPTTTPTATSPDTTVTDTNDTGSSSVTMTTAPDTSVGQESSSSTEDPTIFHFNETDPADYVRVDRKGFPAVNTGLHIHGDKDAYNQGTPEEDAMGDFLIEAGESLELLHWGGADAPIDPGPGLDEELVGLGMNPCTPPESGPLGDDGNCILQGGPAVIPDVLKIDTDLPPGFHFDPETCGPVANGRALADPVMDIIFAVLLIDLSQPIPDGWGIPCPTVDDPGAPASIFLSIGALGGLSLNPPANDLPFDDAFPYLAAAQE